ncbi:MAG: hypothetical protein EG823_06055 [Actinobacteria bacterium]|nr:hypothetical protein [Actinomycetota bacterium]
MPGITVDDLKRKAIQIKDMAEAEVRVVAEERAAKLLLVGAVALIAVVSVAYYLGTRRSFPDEF